jgi:hypothetical protein
MKATVKENETFKPITIELVIESEQELCDLWLRLNLPRNIVDEQQVQDYLKYKSTDFNEIVFWEVLDKEVNRLNLRK